MAEHDLLLGERIKARREQIGLSQKALADRAGFPAHQTVSQIENGQRDVKAWELAKLAQALHVSIVELLGAAEPVGASTVLWRKQPGENKEIREAEFLERCRQYAFLESLVGPEAYRPFPYREVKPSGFGWNEARDLGQEMWRQLGLGDRPAKGLVSVLEEQYGVKIWYADLGAECSAACVVGDFGPAILMNREEAPWRRNFNFGHELFHLITWKSFSSNEPGTIHTLTDSMDRLANAFASSLLLPSDLVIPEFERRLHDRKISYVDLTNLAREFDVSSEALLWRLVTLRRMDQGIVESLLADERFRNLDRSSMPGKWWVPPPMPERFVRLAFVAYQKAKLSKTRLVELLGVSLPDLQSTLMEYGLDETADYDTTVSAAA